LPRFAEHLLSPCKDVLSVFRLDQFIDAFVQHFAQAIRHWCKEHDASTVIEEKNAVSRQVTHTTPALRRSPGMTCTQSSAKGRDLAPLRLSRISIAQFSTIDTH
jgi:non-homologous end joining protein Ku